MRLNINVLQIRDKKIDDEFGNLAPSVSIENSKFWSPMTHGARVASFSTTLVVTLRRKV